MSFSKLSQQSWHLLNASRSMSSILYGKPVRYFNKKIGFVTPINLKSRISLILRDEQQQERFKRTAIFLAASTAFISFINIYQNLNENEKETSKSKSITPKSSFDLSFYREYLLILKKNFVQIASSMFSLKSLQAKEDSEIKEVRFVDIFFPSQN